MTAPKEIIITREDLRKLLLDWQGGKLSAKQVHDWAEDRFAVDGYDYEDWEGPEDDSVSKEVLGMLDKLDMDLVIPEDIPYYLDFLQAPAGGYSEANAKLQKALGGIDYRARKQKLKSDPLYAPFCQET